MNSHFLSYQYDLLKQSWEGMHIIRGQDGKSRDKRGKQQIQRLKRQEFNKIKSKIG